MEAPTDRVIFNARTTNRHSRDHGEYSGDDRPFSRTNELASVVLSYRPSDDKFNVAQRFPTMHNRPPGLHLGPQRRGHRRHTTPRGPRIGRGQRRRQFQHKAIGQQQPRRPEVGGQSR